MTLHFKIRRLYRNICFARSFKHFEFPKYFLKWSIEKDWGWFAIATMLSSIDLGDWMVAVIVVHFSRPLLANSLLYTFCSQMVAVKSSKHPIIKLKVTIFNTAKVTLHNTIELIKVTLYNWANNLKWAVVYICLLAHCRNNIWKKIQTVLSYMGVINFSFHSHDMKPK